MIQTRGLPSSTRNIPSLTLSKVNQNGRISMGPRIIEIKTLFIIMIAIGLLAVVPVRAQTSNLGSLNGVILGAEGAIDGATVNLRSEGTSPGHASIDFITGPDGRYSFEGLVISNGYIVSVIFDQTNHSMVVFIDDATNQADFSFTGRVDVQLDVYDGSIAGGVEVSLYNYLYGNEVNSTTGSSGQTVFNGLDINSDYYLGFFHQGVQYFEEFSFNGTDTAQVAIEILEGTKSDEDFKILNHHVVIYTAGSELRYWDQVAYHNMGDQVFNTSWLNGWIPDDATDITHDTMDCCINFLGQGDYTFDPMDPLFPEDSFGIELNYYQEVKIPTHIIEKRVIYDTASMFFLIEEKEDVTVEAIENLVYRGIETFGDTRYHAFDGVNLKAGDIIRLEMKTDVTILDLIAANSLIWGPLILGVPLGLIYLYMSKRKAPSPSGLEDEQQEIFESLAQAERDLKAHRITQKEFEKLRARYKRKSIQVLKKINKPQQEPVAHREEPSDGLSDLKAVESVIKSIKKDYESGDLSEESYKAIISKYEEKRDQLIGKIRDSVELDIEKGADE